MAKSKGIYVAVAPLVLLLIAGVGAHFLPILLGDKDADADDAPPLRFRSTKHPSVSVASPKLPPPVDAKTQAALEKAVSGQLTAFQKNDFNGALIFASPRFRAVMTPEQFRLTITRSYPLLMNAVAKTFEPAHGTKTMAAIPVLVAANDGSVTRYMYTLGSEGNGWFVTGCAPIGAMPPMDTISPKRAPQTAIPVSEHI